MATNVLSVATVIAALPHLNKTDLRSLQVAIENELLQHSTIDADLFSIVFEVTKEKPISVDRFSNSENGRIWRKNQPMFDDLVKKLVTDTAPKKVVLRALKKFLVELLVQDIKLQELPLTMRTICYRLGSSEAVFDNFFPRYLANNLGHLVVKRLVG